MDEQSEKSVKVGWVPVQVTLGASTGNLSVIVYLFYLFNINL